MFYWKLMSWKPAEMSLREAHQSENPNHLLLKHFLLGINFSKASDSNKSRFKVKRYRSAASLCANLGRPTQNQEI